MTDRPEDPLAGFRFRLTLGNVEIAGFAECTGLEMETSAFEYKEGGVNSHLLKFPEQTQVGNLVLKRGVTLSTELFDWYLDVRRYGSVPHAGFGLGIERTLGWICGLPHVRESIPFPRLMQRVRP